VILRGAGRAAATCGELVQGALTDGTAFQVTLPIDRWAEVRVTVRTSHGPSGSPAIRGIPHERWKLGAAIDQAVMQFVPGASDVEVAHSSPIPVGEGFGSSTADVVAGWRAVASAAGATLSPAEVTARAGQLEPTDGTAFERIVAVTRSGAVLREWRWTPQFVVVAARDGRRVDTMGADIAAFSRDAQIYEDVLGDLDRAAASHDAGAFARAATTSAQLHARRAPATDVVHGLLDVVCDGDAGALGVAVGHTGSCGALLLPRGAGRPAIERAVDAVRRSTGRPAGVYHSL